MWYLFTPKVKNKILINRKIAIVYSLRAYFSIINNQEMNPLGQFILQNLNEQGLNAVVINESESLKNQFNQSNADVVKHLESLSKFKF